VKRDFLVVAGSGQVREELATELRSRGYSVALAASGTEAERVVRSVPVDAALIESHLPDVAADELASRLRQIQPRCRVTRLSSLEQALKKPDMRLATERAFVLHRDEFLDLLLAPAERGKAGERESFAQRGSDSLMQVLDVLVGIHELDDRFFGGSSHQVMVLARAVADEMSGDREMVEEVVLATLLRDVGKIDLDPALLEHEGQLDEQQRQRMNDHVLSTLRLFEHIDFPWKVLPIIRHHHERYDGTGYPDGLRGREIPIGARIVAVVDAYVAMISPRAHRTALTPDQALQELIGEAGHHFDSEVVEVFQRVLDKRLRVHNPDRRAVVLLVEPDEEFRRALKMRLLNEGFEVLQAVGVAAAIESLQRQRADLVVIDADGDPAAAFQLLHELRREPTTAAIPFAMLASGTDRMLKLRALREGVDEFLSKRMDLEELAAHVENVVTREAVRREGGAALRRSGITGRLEQLSLPEIVQTLVIGMKTACVTLNGAAQSGRIWFENGTPRHATAAGLEGENAFYEMVRWNEGEFVIEHGVTGDQQSLSQDAMFLLMEGLRLIDEASVEAASAAP